jgi:hypothetical protein
MARGLMELRREAPVRTPGTDRSGETPRNAGRPAPTIASAWPRPGAGRAESQTVMRTQPALILAGGLVVATLVAGIDAMNIANSRSTLTVTGSARRTVRSDYAVWRGSFAAQAPLVDEAYGELEGQARRLHAYLGKRGFADSAIVLSQVQTLTVYQRLPNGMESSVVEGYRLTQSIEVRSPAVEKIGALSREATELLKDGVQLESNPPQYLVTRLADLKVETLAAATRDAHARAGEMAKNAGSSIGRLRGARMGVFQVTPALSTEVTDSGVNDTSSLDKDITSVVALTFEVR